VVVRFGDVLNFSRSLVHPPDGWRSGSRVRHPGRAGGNRPAV